MGPGPRKLFRTVGIIAVIGALAFGVYHGFHASKKVGESQTISSGQLGTFHESTEKTTDKHIDLPKFNNPVNKGNRLDVWGMFWNGQMALAYAMGGMQTSEGSLFDKAGLDAKFVWQDDCGKTMAAFIANANDIKKDPNTVPIVMLLMGDGGPGFTASAKDLKKLGKDYELMAFDFLGRSDGEDCFWIPKEWKANPKACLGHCVTGVPRDGDVNIILKWCADNNIPVNVNNKYLDRGALNLMDCVDYVEAGNKYITGFSEKRIVVKNGKTFPDSVVECLCEGYTSWTPVDVTVSEKKGGLVRGASTHEYTAQMPCTAIVLKAWAYSSSEHQSALKAFVKACGEAGDQVRSFPDALDFAAKVSALWYGNQPDKPGSYISSLYLGKEMKDATGMRVQVGGSKAFNLADAAMMCGKGKDGIDRYKMTYEYFGGQCTKLWPKEMAGVAPYSSFMDKSFIGYVLDNNGDLAGEQTEEDQKPVATGDITNEVSSKPYNIKFALGSAKIDPSSKSMIAEIFKSKVISGGLRIGIYGHTDNIGSAKDNGAANTKLSQLRAQAVADYLQSLGIKQSDIVVKGYGDTQPLDGTTASDPQNRCVEIVQGS